MDVPVILSDAGSLPEIAGGKHLIFKSGDKTALIEAMNKAVNGEWNECEKRIFLGTKLLMNLRSYIEVYFNFLIFK